MEYLKLFEKFKELEFIHTETYKEYVKNKFKPYSIDYHLDRRFYFKKIKDSSSDKDDIINFDKEIKAIDFILSKHF
jgi:hypothetical protein